jgi:hypothetical protein
MGRNHRMTLERALARGRLSARQARIARSQIRYHRAMEKVAARDVSVRDAPLLAGVVASSPRRWPAWWRALRAGGRVH